jgi:hypothetical protein
VISALDISASDSTFTVLTVDTMGERHVTTLHALTENGREFVRGAPATPPLWQSRRDE